MAAATAPYAGGKVGHQGTQSRQILRSPGIFGIEHGFHQRGADDHQIRETGHLASLRAIGYAQPDPHHRGGINLAYSPNEFRSGRRGPGPLTGNAHHRRGVYPAAASGHCVAQPLVCRGWRDEEDPVQIMVKTAPVAIATPESAKIHGHTVTLS